MLGNDNVFSYMQSKHPFVKPGPATSREVTGRNIHVIEGERREGDPAVLVADSSCAQSELGWAPKFDDLNSIVSHAWSWGQKSGKDQE
jgi:UDP-glucose 4-epimerase